MKTSPEDNKAIHEFIGEAKKFLDLEMPIEKATEVMNIYDKIAIMLKMVPKMRSLEKWSSLTIEVGVKNSPPSASRSWRTCQGNTHRSLQRHHL